MKKSNPGTDETFNNGIADDSIEIYANERLFTHTLSFTVYSFTLFCFYSNGTVHMKLYENF